MYLDLHTHSHDHSHGLTCWGDGTTRWSYPVQSNVYTANVTYWPESQAAEKEQKAGMRGFYEVFIIDPESGRLALHEFVTAKSEASARIKAWGGAALGGDPDDFDFIVRKLGDLRPEKEPVVVNIANK